MIRKFISLLKTSLSHVKSSSASRSLKSDNNQTTQNKKSPQQENLDELFYELMQNNLSQACDMLESGFIPNDICVSKFINMFDRSNYSNTFSCILANMPENVEVKKRYIRNFVNAMAFGMKKDPKYKEKLIKGNHSTLRNLNYVFLTLAQFKSQESLSHKNISTTNLISMLTIYREMKNILNDVLANSQVVTALDNALEPVMKQVEQTIANNLEKYNEQLKKENFAHFSLSQALALSQTSENKVVNSCAQLNEKINNTLENYHNTMSVEQKVFLTQLRDKDLSLISTNAMVVTDAVQKQYLEKTGTSLQDSLLEVVQKIESNVDSIILDCISKSANQVSSVINQTNIYLTEKEKSIKTLKISA